MQQGVFWAPVTLPGGQSCFYHITYNYSRGEEGKGYHAANIYNLSTVDYVTALYFYSKYI